MKKKFLIGGLTLALVAVVVWFVMSLKTMPELEPTKDTTASAPQPSDIGPVAQQDIPERTGNTHDAGRVKSVPSPSYSGSMGAMAAHQQHFYEEAKALHKAARFPHDSGLFQAGRDPVKKRLQPSVKRRTSPDGSWGVVSWMSTISSNATSPVRICAAVDALHPRQISPSPMELTLSPGMTPGAAVATVTLDPNGCPDDFAAGVVLNPELLGAERQFWRASISTNVDGETVTVSHLFHHGPARASLTGHVKESMVKNSKGNHLKLSAEIDVSTEGTFWLSGTLYDVDDNPVGRASQRVSLKPGVHEVSLTFYGLMFCEAAMDGPYTLRHALLMDVTTPPGVNLEHLQDGFVTSKLVRSDFTCEPFDDPGFTRRAQLAEKMAVSF